MQERRKVVRLEEELRKLRAELEEIRVASKEVIAPLLVERLQQEKQRCERYNHFFSLLMLASKKVSARGILKRVGGSVRASDVVGILDGDGRFHDPGRAQNAADRRRTGLGAQDQERVVMVLPETDREGAESALRRLTGILTDKDQVTFGMGVFPDDATNVEKLMSIATV